VAKDGIEGQDFVVCRECGHRGAKLYRHIESAHGLTTSAYTEKHGVDAPLRCSAAKAKQDASRTARLGASPKTWRETKEVACPSCGKAHLVGKQMGKLHDLRCSECKKELGYVLPLLTVWMSKVEGVDYVVCRDCAHRAENLTSHVTHLHPGYRERYPDAPLVADESAVRDKSSLKERVLSAVTRHRMSVNAGRWNAGLTKETDERVARAAEKMRGRVSWSRGLTKETDPRLAGAVEKLRAYMGANRTWGNGLKAELTPEDFEPYLDEHGRVDRRAAEEGLGLSWRTLFTYMEVLGLATSDVHVKARAEAATLHIEREDLLRFALGNGKVSIGAAMSGLGHSFPVIKKECGRHGLETFHRRIRQTLCLDAVAKALGVASFVQEWETMRFTNPKTGRRFRFDGYYEDWNLIVEFHGHQHWQFPNAYMLDESYRPLWEESCWRDQEKVRLATEAGIHYLVVREDEPFTDPVYLAGRLVQMGVLKSDQVPLRPIPCRGGKEVSVDVQQGLRR